MTFTPLDISLSGILVMGVVALILVKIDEYRDKKYQQQKKDRLEIIEDALQILAKKDKNIEEALNEAGFYKQQE